MNSAAMEPPFVVAEGRILRPADARVNFDPILDGGALTEIGVHAGKPLLRRRSVAQLTQSCEALALQPRKREWGAAIDIACRQLVGKNAVLELLVLGEASYLIVRSTRPDAPMSLAGVQVPAAPSLVGPVPAWTTSRGWALAAQRDAQQRGFDDALLLDAQHMVIEATNFGIWWFAESRVQMSSPLVGATPFPVLEAVPDILRAVGVRTERVEAPLEALLSAEMVYGVRAGVGCWPIPKVDGHRLPGSEEAERLCGIVHGALHDSL